LLYDPVYYNTVKAGKLPPPQNVAKPLGGSFLLVEKKDPENSSLDRLYECISGASGESVGTDRWEYNGWWCGECRILPITPVNVPDGPMMNL
jgi:hypothetical protein